MARFEKRDAFVAKCKVLAPEEQYMMALAEEARGRRARVAELEEASKAKASKVLDESRTADKKMASKHICTMRAEYIARISKLEGDS